jgi:hypothetical protein
VLPLLLQFLEMTVLTQVKAIHYLAST